MKPKLRAVKTTAIKIFKEGGFELLKWKSNVPELDKAPPETQDEETTYAKLQLNVRENTSKILGVLWDKQNDTLSVNFAPSKEMNEFTKRGVLNQWLQSTIH